VARQAERFTTYGLREIYHELGTYEFKIVLNPRFFTNSHLSEISFLNPDGGPMTCSVDKWGRKINCSFTVDDGIPDGVILVNMRLVDDKEQVTNHRLTLWVVKP
jgi:hypothetical protein